MRSRVLEKNACYIDSSGIAKNVFRKILKSHIYKLPFLMSQKCKIRISPISIVVTHHIAYQFTQYTHAELSHSIASFMK